MLENNGDVTVNTSKILDDKTTDLKSPDKLVRWLVKDANLRKLEWNNAVSVS